MYCWWQAASHYTFRVKASLLSYDFCVAWLDFLVYQYQRQLNGRSIVMHAVRCLALHLNHCWRYWKQGLKFLENVEDAFINLKHVQDVFTAFTQMEDTTLYAKDRAQMTVSRIKEIMSEAVAVAFDTCSPGDTTMSSSSISLAFSTPIPNQTSIW